LPDGIFSNKKYQFGLTLEGLGMENVGIFMVIWNIESPFGTFCGHLVNIFPFWYVLPSKIWQPWPAVVPSHDFTIIRVTK
jgi:hypothetical protein